MRMWHTRQKDKNFPESEANHQRDEKRLRVVGLVNVMNNLTSKTLPQNFNVVGNKLLVKNDIRLVKSDMRW
jgi:hypothetical protein